MAFGGVLAKYVRLNIKSNWGDAKNSGLSEVRFFYVPVKAFEPTPATGATGVAVDGVLNWRPGRTAAGHEVYFGTDPSQDWTVCGMKTLVLHFYEASDNGADQLYVKINGTRVDYTGSAAALTTAAWKQWNVDLMSVSGLQAVNTLTIGVSGTGKGILYIDDIRVSRP